MKELIVELTFHLLFNPTCHRLLGSPLIFCSQPRHGLDELVPPRPRLLLLLFHSQRLFLWKYFRFQTAKFRISLGVKLKTELIFGDCWPWALSNHTGAFTFTTVSRTFLEAYHLTAVTAAPGHAVGGPWTLSLDAPLRQGPDLTETSDRVYLSPYGRRQDETQGNRDHRVRGLLCVT